MYKVCKKCEIKKHITEFYIHRAMTDGRLSFCKECVKERVRDYSHTEHSRQLAALWCKTKKGRAKQKRHLQRYKRLNPEKYRATMTAGNAIRSGKLIKQPCEVCGDRKAEKHHDDYSKPLEVRWLCMEHHRMLHFKEEV